MPMGSSVQVQYMSSTKQNKETHVDNKFITSSSNDTVTCRIQYLQILGELFEWQTQQTYNMVLKFERKKKLCQVTFK